MRGAILRHARCTLSRTGCRLSHPAENIYESYSCVQILTIPTSDFIGRTATSGSTGLSVSHDLNVYPRCVEWLFTGRHHKISQLFKTSILYRHRTYPTMPSSIPFSNLKMLMFCAQILFILFGPQKPPFPISGTFSINFFKAFSPYPLINLIVFYFRRPSTVGLLATVTQ